MSATSWEVLGSNPAGFKFSGNAGGVSDHAESVWTTLDDLSKQTPPTTL